MAGNSAGVYIREIDASQGIQAVATSIGAIVGPSAQGPVGVPTLVTSAKNFVNIYGKPNPQLTYMHYCALAFLNTSQALYVTRVANAPLYGGMVCSVVSGFNQSSPWTAGQSNPITGYVPAAADLFAIYGIDQGVWNDTLSVSLYPAQPSIPTDNTFKVDVFVSPSTVPVESFTCTLVSQLDGFGKQMQIDLQINRFSNYIKVILNSNATAIQATPKAKIVNAIDGATFAGGSDGLAINDSHIINGWAEYADPEAISINILINGGYSDPAVQLAIDTLCRDRMDCVAVLDMPSASQSINSALTYRRSTLNLDSSWSAMYSPDLLAVDPYTGQQLYIPPSGYVAAVYALTDSVASAWSAPAGMTRGGLNVLGLAQNYQQGDRDVLDAAQINAIRVVYAAGIKIWGSSTMQVMASALSEISVRRLMIMLEQSIARASLYSAFEDNTPSLRLKLTNITNSFLQPIKNAGGVFDFNVVCDNSNNTNDLIATGDTVLDVYIDPALPVKRIHLNAIIARTGGIAFALNQVSGK